MTSFERVCIGQLIAAGMIGTAAFVWGNSSIRFSIVPWCIAWSGAVAMLTQVTERNGVSKVVFGNSEPCPSHLFLPLTSAMVGVLVASFAGFPVLLAAWLVGAL